MSRTFTIGVRRAEQGDAEAITQVHDASWRYAYDGIIPAKELARIIARRGPRWWDRAIRRGTAILVIEVGGKICGYATFGPNRARNLVRFGFDSVVVWALADNEGACRFYRNAGGRKVARANERFGDTALTKVA